MGVPQWRTEGADEAAPKLRNKGEASGEKAGKGKGGPVKVTAEGGRSQSGAPGLRVRGHSLRSPSIEGIPEDVKIEKEQIDQHLADPRIVELYEGSMQRSGTQESRDEAAFQFAGMMIDNSEVPTENLLAGLGNRFSVLTDQARFVGEFCRVVGASAPVKDATREPSGRLL